MAQPFNTRYRKPKRISLQDIKFDLLKIIEPYDGVLYGEPTYALVTNLFDKYLGDLKNWRMIADYTIASTARDNSITLDVAVKLSVDRSPKKLKIHVGLYKSNWPNIKAEAA
tara:strand:- start:4597 stop:4932 length:336 start_codon:yes stop_codon:yes gene_type:complete